MKFSLKLSVVWETFVWVVLAVIVANWFFGGFLHPLSRIILGDIIFIDVGIAIGRYLHGRKKPYLDRIDAAMASICYRKPDNESSVVVDLDDVRAVQEDGRLPPFFNVEDYFATHRINDYLRANGLTLPVRVSA